MRPYLCTPLPRWRYNPIELDTRGKRGEKYNVAVSVNSVYTLAPNDEMTDMPRRYYKL
jgi:hypothetical protein